MHGLNMYLAAPGRVLTVAGADPAFRAGCVDFRGVRKTVSLAFTAEAGAGDFVLVHVGLAISRIDEDEATQTFSISRSDRRAGYRAAKVRVRIGEFAGVDGESLRFCFEAIVMDTPRQSMELVIESGPRDEPDLGRIEPEPAELKEVCA